MTKKLMTMVVAFAVSFGAWADTETVDGYTWTYRINGDTAEIYGTYNSSSYPYTPAISPSPTGAVTIPATLGGKPVTKIGEYAFYGCSGLTSVMIPDSVTSIGDHAFYKCSGLASATIPDAVTSIGMRAFFDCALEHITIPTSITNFGRECFVGCPAYESKLYRMILGDCICGGSSTTVVQQVETPYALTDAAADRAIASVTVDGDCAIDSFVLKEGKVYDSVLYISNTASQAVTLTLPAGYTYKAIKGAKPLVIPAKSQSILSITRVADSVFLVAREDLETIQQ